MVCAGDSSRVRGARAAASVLEFGVARACEDPGASRSPPGSSSWSSRSYCGVGLPPCSSRWLSPAPHASRRCVDDPSPVVLGSIVNRFGCCGLLRPSLRGFCSPARVGPADGCLLHSHSRLSTCGAPDATPVQGCEQDHIPRIPDRPRMGGWPHEHRPRQRSRLRPPGRLAVVRLLLIDKVSDCRLIRNEYLVKFLLFFFIFLIVYLYALAF